MNLLHLAAPGMPIKRNVRLKLMIVKFHLRILLIIYIRNTDIRKGMVMEMRVVVQEIMSNIAIIVDLPDIFVIDFIINIFDSY